MVLDVPSLVGRKAEIEEVSRFVDLDRAGPAALALVGESGIGKTTLLRTAQAMASERSYRVLTCRPIQGEVRLSFAALSDLFEGVEDETLSQLPPPQRQALEAALLRKEWTQDPVDERAVSAAVLSVLRILSSAGPVLIAADDVQWLDQPSARALGFAFRRLEHEHVRLLAVERHPVRHDGEASFLSLLPRDALELLALGPISLDELDQLLRTRLELLLLRPTLEIGRAHV